MKTLILNNAYSPLGTITWQRAVCLILSNKAEALEDYDYIIKSPNLSIKMPSVIRINKNIKAKIIRIRFNKTNIYFRDNGKCQYCSIELKESQSTFDHIRPKSQGGATDWTNIVLCCVPCNQRKQDRRLSETGMLLSRKPVKPDIFTVGQIFYLKNKLLIPDNWKKYMPL